MTDDPVPITPFRAARVRRSLRLASHAPGRARWRTPALRARSDIQAVSATLRAEAGVIDVEVNPLTASVLVTFDRELELARIEDGVVRALQMPIAADADDDPHAFAVHAHHDHDHHDHAAAPHLLLRDVIFGGIALAFSLAARWGLISISAGTATTLVALLTARRYFRGAWHEISEGTISTDVLVSAGVTAALMTGEPLTALSIVWLLNAGEYGHAVTLRRTRTAIRNLLAADDGHAWLWIEGTDVRVPVSELRPGNIISVYPNERIPADGEVVEGGATIDEASISGESTPVAHGACEQVYAGTIVLAVRDRFRVRVQRVGAETAIGQMIRRVEEAEALRAPMELIGDRFASVFVPSAVLLSIATLLLTGNVSSAVAILLMACPCAVGLATPSPVSAAIGNAARRGILIKGGVNLEAAATVDLVVFDKTGTLTLGQPVVARTIVLAGDLTEVGLLELAASAIHYSHHPLSRAIVEHARNRGVRVFPVETFVDHPGEGVAATLEAGPMLVGSARLLERYGVAVPEAELQTAESVVYVAAGGRPAGIITIITPLRAEAAAAVAMLRQLIPDFIMLTGDRAEAAAHVADHVGISEWRAAQSPEEKYALIRELRASGRRVAMIGDGINDAPSLAAADLGIAMSTGGSDVAIDAAGLALASNDLRAVATTVQLSRETVRIIRQNYALSFAINGIGVVAGFYGLVSPLVAAILHNLGAIGVVANSARLIHYRPLLPEQAIDISHDSCILSATSSS